MKKNSKKIVKDFYEEYCRSPKKKEFEDCGGNAKYIAKIYGSYENFLFRFGYPSAQKGETYEVVDARTHKVIFSGTTSDIVEEFSVCRSTIRRAYKRNSIFQNKYRIRIKLYKKSSRRSKLKKGG